MKKSTRMFIVAMMLAAITTPARADRTEFVFAAFIFDAAVNLTAFTLKEAVHAVKDAIPDNQEKAPKAAETEAEQDTTTSK